MGTNVSKQLVESTTKTVNNAMTRITNSAENVSTLNVHSYQTIQMDLVGAKIIRCPVTITNGANVSGSSWSDTNTTLTAELTNNLTNKIKETIKQSLDQVNSGFNLGQTNIGIVTTKTQTWAENNLKNIIDSSIKNVISNSGSSDQSIWFKGKYLTCEDSPITISQSVVLSVLSKQIASNLVSEVIKNTVAIDIDKLVDQKVSQLNKGLDLGFGILGLVFIIIIGICIKKLVKKQPTGADGVKLPVPLPLKIAKISLYVVPVLFIIGLITYFVVKRNANNKKINLSD